MQGRMGRVVAGLSGLIMGVTVVAATPASGAEPVARDAAAMHGGQTWVGGQPTVNGTWRAATAGWPAGTTFSYAWTLDGVVVSQAATYSATTAALGEKVRLSVTGTAPGYAGSATQTTPALRVQPQNPLAGGRWGVATRAMTSFDPAAGLGGAAARIAHQPRVMWLVHTHKASGIKRYIKDVQHGDPNVLVQFALFREFYPTGEDGALTTTLTAAQQAGYRSWLRSTSAAIGNTRAAIVLEPDMAIDAPRNFGGTWNRHAAAVRLSLVKYAAKWLHDHNHRATVYLDAGDADWQSVGQEVTTLRAAGIAYARGFALGATHYGPLARRITGENAVPFHGEIDYAAKLGLALRKAGLGTRHAVIDTADNGQGFSWGEYTDTHGKKACNANRSTTCFNNALTCKSKAQRTCDTLGANPTWQVLDAPGVQLPAAQRAQAMTWVDGYLWFGRPWLLNQAWPLRTDRATQVATTTPIPAPASVCWRATVPLTNPC